MTTFKLTLSYRSALLAKKNREAKSSDKRAVQSVKAKEVKISFVCHASKVLHTLYVYNLLL